MTFIVNLGSDIRECRREGDFYIHVLNSAFRIAVTDNRIVSVKPVQNPTPA
jgi:hypothetical protein